MRALLPRPDLALFFGIGLLDLVATATLSAQGMIEERNPFMAPLLNHGILAFVLVRLAILGIAWMALSRAEPRQARQACFWGSGAYLALMLTAFVG